MAFVVTPVDPTTPGPFYRVYDVSALDADLEVSVDPGFPWTPQWFEVQPVDGTTCMYVGTWRVFPDPLPGAPSRVTLRKNGLALSGGTCRVIVGTIPGAKGA